MIRKVFHGGKATFVLFSMNYKKKKIELFKIKVRRGCETQWRYNETVFGFNGRESKEDFIVVINLIKGKQGSDSL